MTQEEIVEGNALIADFMNLKVMEWDYIGTPIKIWIDKDTETTVHDEPELWYHSSWDWLMPVVEKIEEMGFIFYTAGLSVRIEKIDPDLYVYDDMDVEGIDSKIKAMWLAVIAFIQWYQNNTKNS